MASTSATAAVSSTFSSPCSAQKSTGGRKLSPYQQLAAGRMSRQVSHCIATESRAFIIAPTGTRL